ncbi:helix-turn-helix domain-containing protein [Shinella sp.]|uniref:helix-turn-helix domain-containing protein n=1 Tax=Shinella sp. TaxID=1870904 RepID=UPI0039E2EA0F
MTDLPVVIAEIERVAGREAALKLAMAKGGLTIYTPYSVTADHWLSQLVGLEAAMKICEHYRVGNTGARILIPIAKQAMQRRALVEALEAGASAPKAAEAAGMHERSAYRNRKRLRDERQGKLF